MPPTPPADDELSSRRFRASETARVVGLTYRQLRTLEERTGSAAPRQGKGEWNTYTFRNVFAILICVEIRDRFGVPLNRLTWLIDFMLQPGTDHFAYAHETIRKMGFAVFLLTDLKSVFHMGTDIDLEEMLQLGYFRHDEPEAYYLMKINPIINRILELTKHPEPLKVRSDFYQKMNKVDRLWRASNLEERDLLRFVRDRKNRSVKVQLNDAGEIMHFECEREEPSSSDIAALIAKDAFQTVEIKKRRGEVTLIRRRISREVRRNTDESGKRTLIVDHVD
ncbi:MAG TPA: hypothetical protein VN380_16965 [Thermoanaerobaculia bacterium]|jgi:hypothetical protein|nr:hypothetical protein [Thermoanaerobaculia bacterium]